MSLVDFIQASRDRTLAQNIGELIVGYRRRTGWLEKRSTHIFEKDWDVLCILDACRLDLMQDVAPEYGFLGEVDSIYSVGATSPMWLENTFGPLSDDTLAKTAYVTGNPWSGRLNIGLDSLGVLEECWRTTWNDDIGYQPPRPLTNRAINVWRERNDINRLIVHYMQPHVPFVNNPEITRQMGVTEESPDEKPVWNKVRDGEIDRDRVWSAYKENLRFVLDDLNLLRENIDAETLAVSADHGNAMGEFGQAGHEYGTLVQEACEVPWIELECENSGDYTPKEASVNGDNSTTSEQEEIVAERLSALGYTE